MLVQREQKPLGKNLVLLQAEFQAESQRKWGFYASPGDSGAFSRSKSTHKQDTEREN